MNLDSHYLGSLPPAKTSLSAAAPHAPSKHDQLVHQTQVWVAQTFYGQLLKQMRNSPFKSEMFSGGRGGEAFSSMFDQRLSERMSKGAGSKLVNAIVRKIEARSAYAKHSQPLAASRPQPETRDANEAQLPPIRTTVSPKFGRANVTTTD